MDTVEHINPSSDPIRLAPQDADLIQVPEGDRAPIMPVGSLGWLWIPLAVLVVGTIALVAPGLVLVGIAVAVFMVPYRFMRRGREDE
jgi:hypothetical protein